MKIIKAILDVLIVLGATVMLTLTIWLTVEIIRDFNGCHDVARFRVYYGRIETRRWDEFTEQWVDEEWTVIS